MKKFIKNWFRTLGWSILISLILSIIFISSVGLIALWDIGYVYTSSILAILVFVTLITLEDYL